MAFCWKDYLDLARLLQSQGSSSAQEAAFRSAVSRAYFAAYCHARNYARDKQHYAPREDSEDHGRLREHFKSRNMWEVAQSLDKLRQWRNDCDYKDTIGPNLFQLVSSAIQKAEAVINRLSVTRH